MVDMTEKILIVFKEIDKKIWDSWCNRCGYCCKIWDFTKEPPEDTGNYCSHLKWIDSKSFCDIYPNCYGTQLELKGVCVPVEYVYKRADNCPYNKILNNPKFKILRVKEEKL